MHERSKPANSTPPAPEPWLLEERLPEDELLDRLNGDAELVAARRASKFVGPDYDYVQEELVRYGVGSRGLDEARVHRKHVR